MTYNERIEAIAREMQQNCGLVVNAHNLNTIFIPAARIAVKHMAEALRDALSELLPTDEEDYKNGDNNKYVIPGYLSANGLIPDNAQKGNKD